MGSRLIGATDISAIVGLNPWANARDVYDRIVLGKDRKTGKAAARGLRVEPLIREAAVNQYGVVLEEHPGIVAHPAHHWATASPDDWVLYEGVRCVIDYKSTSIWAAKKWGDDQTDACPEHYQIQMHWNKAVGGFERSLLLAAFGEDYVDEAGQDQFAIKFFRLYRMWREPDIEAALLAAGKRFWFEHVVPRQPPSMEPMEEIKKREAKARRKAKETAQ